MTVRTTRRVLMGGALAGAAATLLVGAAGAQDESTLVFAVESMNGNFEPTTWNGFGDSVIAMDSLARGLTQATFEGDGIVGAVAESWEVSDDGRAYTFRIRPGMTFHDGTEVTAEDVMRTFNRILDPEDPTRPEGTGAIDNLGGDNLEGIETVDDMTVRFSLREPDAGFPARLARPDMVILSGAALDEHGSDIGQHIVSVGPYKLGSVTPGERAVLEAFDGFYKGRPAIDRVVLQVLPDPLAMTTALAQGSVGMTVFAPHSNLEQLAASGRVEVFEPVPFVTLFLTMNATHPPLDDIRVRKAINMAIDRQAIVDEVFFGYAETPGYMLTKGQVGYAPEHERFSEQRMEEAKALLEEAGAVGATLTLTSQNSLFWPKLGQVVQRNLEELGLAIEPQYVESGSFFGTLYDAEQSQLGLEQRSAFIPDPDGKFSPLFFTGTASAEGATAHTGLPTQPELDAKLLEALREQDPERRAQLYVDLNEWIAENLMVHAILAAIYTPVVATAGIGGVDANAAGTYRVYLEDVELGG